jgi:hypothetical protein
MPVGATAFTMGAPVTDEFIGVGGTVSMPDDDPKAPEREGVPKLLHPPITRILIITSANVVRDVHKS